MAASQRRRGLATALSVAFFALLMFAWHLATLPAGGAPVASASADPEYLKLIGKDPGTNKITGFPTPKQIGEAAWKHITNPVYDNGPNDKGIAIQLGHSLLRVGSGFLLACLIAIPLGFVIGMSPLLSEALNPFIQVLKPISPLAWMPLALYTIKDASTSGIFVIFICSIWPMLINTAFGVAGVRRDLLNVAATLEVTPLRRAFLVILPAAAPTIVTGMRISMSIAWLVIVAAEMLVGGTGIGYFVWNEWNNLSITNVIFAILIIGVSGMFLDFLFARLQQLVSYVD